MTDEFTRYDTDGSILYDEDMGALIQEQTDEPKPKSELKPCPFCGGNATISLDDEIYCQDCGVCPEPMGNDPITAWNTRAEPKEIPEWLKVVINDQLNLVQNYLKGIKKQDYPLDVFNDIKGNMDGYIGALNWVLSLKDDNND